MSRYVIQRNQKLRLEPADVVSRDEDSSEKDGETEFVRVPIQRHPIGFGIGFPRHGLFEPPQHPLFVEDPFFRGISPFGGIGPQSDDDDNDRPDDFLTQMQAILREMRKQLKTLADQSHGLDDEGVVGTRIGGDDDLPKNQTTSTTKVIDGHVVTVNETTYSSGDGDIGAVFKIRVVEVVPSESPEDSGTSEEPSSSDAPDIENENTSSKSELEEDKHEETNEIPNIKVPVRYAWSPEFDPSLNEIEQPESDTFDDYGPIKADTSYDLSSDTKVNDFFSDQAQSQGLVMIDPDAELVDANANTYYHYDKEPQRLPV